MQKILLVEDNELQASVLLDTIHIKYPDWSLTHVSNYDDAIDAINRSVHSSNFTLFLLDIHLTVGEKDTSGYLIAKYIRNINVYFRTPLLFLTSVTGDERYAMSNFHCYNYINKPYNSESILEQISQMLITGYLDNMILICDTGRIKHHISINDITFIETCSRRKKVWTRNSGYIETSMYTFDDFLKMTDSRLIQCHKNYLINPNYIDNTDRFNRCLNINSHNVPIGRKYQDLFFSQTEPTQ